MSEHSCSHHAVCVCVCVCVHVCVYVLMSVTELLVCCGIVGMFHL